MNRELRILSHAHRDFSEIVGWLSNNSVDGANRWVDAFDAALATIGETPFAQPLAAEAEFVKTEIRQILFHTRRGRNYRIVFAVFDDEIRIVRVRAPGQDLLIREDLALD